MVNGRQEVYNLRSSGPAKTANRVGERKVNHFVAKQ